MHKKRSFFSFSLLLCPLTFCFHCLYLDTQKLFKPKSDFTINCILTGHSWSVWFFFCCRWFLSGRCHCQHCNLFGYCCWFGLQKVFVGYQVAWWWRRRRHQQPPMIMMTTATTMMVMMMMMICTHVHGSFRRWKSASLYCRGIHKKVTCLSSFSHVFFSFFSNENKSNNNLN